MSKIRISAATTALLASAVLSLGLVACGDSDDGDSNGGGAEVAAGSGGDGASGADGDGSGAAGGESGDGGSGDGDSNGGGADPKDAETAIRDEIRAVQDLAFAADAKAWCARISRRAAEESAASGKKGETCEDVFKRWISAPVPLSQRDRGRIVKVKVAGDRGIVTIRPAGDRPRPIPVVKEDGRWKVDAGFQS